MHSSEKVKKQPMEKNMQKESPLSWEKQQSEKERERQRDSECGKINVNQFIVSFWILLLVIAAGSKVDFDIYFN